VNQIAAKIKDYWDQAGPEAAHITPSKKMFDHFEELVASKVNTHGKTIVDFGCGGGILGLYLLKYKGAKGYVGYDIAASSIEGAHENLKGYRNVDLIQSVLPPFNFAEKKPDIFISIACVIHFPDKEYLDDWLSDVNRCGAQDIIIEIRDTKKGTRFDEIPCEGRWQTRLICLTNDTYVTNKLSRYYLASKTDPRKNKINCQILYFKRAGT
jgi:SAM-dependent methyltransferase